MGAILASEGARSLVGVVDQGIAALAGAIPVVVLGRLAGAAELGVYSLAVSAALFATIAIQSLFLSGYPIFRAEDRAWTDVQTFHVVLFGFRAQTVLAPLSLCGLVAFAYPGLGPPLGLAVAAFVTTTVLRAYLRALSLGVTEAVHSPYGALRAAGFRFVTVSRLLEAAPDPTKTAGR